MNRYFTITLLITLSTTLFSCRTTFVSLSSDARNINVTDSILVPSVKMINIYTPFMNVLEKDMVRVISFSTIEMEKGKPESTLTNFLADLLLEEGRKEANRRGINEPDIFYFNYGGIRTSLPKGEITVGKVFELMPFENEMVLLALNGKQVQEFCDIIAFKGGDSIGGVKFTISDNKAKNLVVDGQPVNIEHTYWLVTNDYVANGGDGLQVLGKSTETINTSLKIRDVIITYMESVQANGEMVTSKVDGRITYE